MEAAIDLTHTDYLAIPRLSKSIISECKSPRHMLAAIERMTGERKPSFDEGTAFHAFILEPGKYEAKVAIKPDIPRRKDEDKALWALWEAANKKKAWISRGYHEGLSGMRNGVFLNDSAAALLSSGTAEQSYLWTDEHGLEWKMRADWITEDEYSTPVIVDLKKTGKGADPETFTREIVNYKYHWQAYIYKRGFRFVIGKDARFILIAVEDAPPHGCMLYEIDGDWLDKAEAKIEPIVKQLARLKDVDQELWPSYPEGIIKPPVPAWA